MWRLGLTSLLGAGLVVVAAAGCASSPDDSTVHPDAAVRSASTSASRGPIMGPMPCGLPGHLKIAVSGITLLNDQGDARDARTVAPLSRSRSTVVQVSLSGGVFQLASVRAYLVPNEEVELTQYDLGHQSVASQLVGESDAVVPGDSLRVTVRAVPAGLTSSPSAQLLIASKYLPGPRAPKSDGCGAPYYGNVLFAVSLRA